MSAEAELASSVWNKPELWADRWPTWRAAFLERGVFCVHVPKAGGTSVVMALYGENKSQHYTAVELISDPDLKTLPSFAVVRNPYWKFVSAYNYLRAGGNLDIATIADNLAWARLLADLDITAFLNLLIDRADGGEHLTTLMALHGAKDFCMWELQSSFVCDDDGERLVQRVFQMEEISATGTLNITTAKGPEVIEVGHFNKTAVKAVLELDGEAAELIYELYFEDFTQFGYGEDSWKNHHLTPAERWNASSDKAKAKGPLGGEKGESKARNAAWHARHSVEEQSRLNILAWLSERRAAAAAAAAATL